MGDQHNPPPGLISLKYCKNVTGAQNMLIYILGYITYIFVREVDAPKANLLKKGSDKQNWMFRAKTICLSLLRRGFNTAKIKAKDSLPDFSLNMASNWGGGVIQTIFEEYDTENDI